VLGTSLQGYLFSAVQSGAPEHTVREGRRERKWGGRGEKGGTDRGTDGEMDGKRDRWRDGQRKEGGGREREREREREGIPTRKGVNMKLFD